jgi:outer membrane protein TolC
VEYQHQALAAQLFRDLQVSLTALAFNEKILVSSQEQEVLALELLAQEQIRFKEGESTQFVLISREKVALEAQLKRIDATIDRFRNELMVHATLAKLTG